MPEGSQPFSFKLSWETGLPDSYDNHIERRLSNMQGQFQDELAFAAALEEDPVLYEVYELERPHNEGELLSGVSVVHPGKIGDEFFMTKGHFHEVLDTAEFYLCLEGEGVMVMENPEGECVVKTMQPDTAVYVPPGWAHRSVNVSLEEDFIFLFVYPAHAGHDYGTIEQRGFRRIVLDRDGEAVDVENPKWSPEAGG